MSTHIHVGGKEHDRSRLEIIGDDDLRILSIDILANSDFWCGKFNQFRWDTAMGFGVVLPLIKVSLDGRSAQVADFRSAKLGWLDYKDRQYGI